MTLYSPGAWFLYEVDTDRWVDSVQDEIDAVGGELAANSRVINETVEIGATYPQALLRPVAGGHQFDHDGLVLTMELNWERIGDGSEWDHIDLVSLVYEATDPQYVLGMVSAQYEALGVEMPEPIDEDRLANGRIEHPTWLMIFPPEMVEEYGREWVLNLPAERIDELDDGAILICATDQPTGNEGHDAWEQKFMEPMQKLEDAFAEKH